MQERVTMFTQSTNQAALWINALILISHDVSELRRLEASATNEKQGGYRFCLCEGTDEFFQRNLLMFSEARGTLG